MVSPSKSRTAGSVIDSVITGGDGIQKIPTNTYLLTTESINGVKTFEYEKMDTEIPSKGVIGIQLHQGGNAKIEVKHITITPL